MSTFYRDLKLKRWGRRYLRLHRDSANLQHDPELEAFGVLDSWTRPLEVVFKGADSPYLDKPWILNDME
jgi:hypothetical protein